MFALQSFYEAHRTLTFMVSAVFMLLGLLYCRKIAKRQSTMRRGDVVYVASVVSLISLVQIFNYMLKHIAAYP